MVYSERLRRLWRKSLILWWLAFPFACNGCISIPSIHAVREDLFDAAKLSVGTAVGIHADAKITSLLHPGAGWFSYAKKVGIENRDTNYEGLFFGEMITTMFPLGFCEKELWKDAFLMSNKRMIELSVSPHDELFVLGRLFDVEALLQFSCYGQRKLMRHPASPICREKAWYNEQPLGVEVGLTPGIVNVRAGFDPVELVDLVATLLGWDLLGDNRLDTSEQSAATGGEKRAAPEP